MDHSEYSAPWTNRCYWLMGHVEEFQLNAQEALVLILISYFNETSQPVDFDVLAAKCFMDPVALDDTLFSLEQRGYLAISAEHGEMVYSLEPMLDTPVKAGVSFNESLLNEFQEEFGRTFSAGETERVMAMADTYDEKAVRAALAEAAVYDKRNLNYIEKLLTSWHARGLTPEDLENGIR